MLRNVSLIYHCFSIRRRCDLRALRHRAFSVALGSSVYTELIFSSNSRFCCPRIKRSSASTNKRLRVIFSFRASALAWANSGLSIETVVFIRCIFLLSLFFISSPHPPLDSTITPILGLLTPSIICAGELFLGREREGEMEDRALARVAFHPDLAAVSLHGQTAERQTNP